MCDEIEIAIQHAPQSTDIPFEKVKSKMSKVMIKVEITIVPLRYCAVTPLSFALFSISCYF